MPWATISPKKAGLDPAKLEVWRSRLADHGTTGLLVIRRGRIALEWYAPKWSADRPHGTASLAKALVGGVSFAVAMSDGRISPDDPAAKYIPEWASDPLKSKITIRQLATHTSGVSDAEQDGLPHDQLPGWKGDFWKRTPDSFSVALRQAPVLFEPGTRYAYSNPGTAALSYAITAALKGGDIRTLLRERVLDPLGVPERHWSIGYGRAYDVDGLKLYANWGGGSFTARAAARVGQLMMLQGRWNGRELIRPDVVRRVLTDQGLPASAAQRRRSGSRIWPWMVHEYGWDLVYCAARRVRRCGRPAPGSGSGTEPRPHRGAKRGRPW
jgi:CubicO group peptidase (beta-lactamase class C family)